MSKLKSIDEIKQEMRRRELGFVMSGEGPLFRVATKTEMLADEEVVPVLSNFTSAELTFIFVNHPWAWEEMKEKQPPAPEEVDKLQKLKMDTPQIIEVPTEELKTKVYEKLNELNFTWRSKAAYEPKDSRDIYPFYLCPLRGTWDASARAYDDKKYISAEEWLKRFEETQEEEKNQLLAACPWAWEEVHPEQDQEELHYEAERAPKFDQDPYEKPKLWEVPIGLLELTWKVEDELTRDIFRFVHACLFKGYEVNHKHLVNYLRSWVKRNPEILREMALAFSYGSEKYEFASWRKGFNGSIRLYEALLRHLQSYLEGVDFDGQTVGKFTKGNCHRGAAAFSCFAALREEGILDINGRELKL